MTTGRINQVTIVGGAGTSAHRQAGRRYGKTSTTTPHTHTRARRAWEYFNNTLTHTHTCTTRPTLAPACVETKARKKSREGQGDFPPLFFPKGKKKGEKNHHGSTASLSCCRRLLATFPEQELMSTRLRPPSLDYPRRGSKQEEGGTHPSTRPARRASWFRQPAGETKFPYQRYPPCK